MGDIGGFIGILGLSVFAIVVVALTIHDENKHKNRLNQFWTYPEPKRPTPTYEYGYPYPMPTSSMCIAGFICGLVLTGVLGLIFSIIGIKECNERGYSGKGLGIAGLVISLIKLGLIVLFLSCWGCACASIIPYRYFR